VPEPIKGGRRYMPGLDGIRAIAVLGVIAYHLGVSALPGGLLGVSVFFTLSGYLITDLLLNQLGSGESSLASFWMARARRLLPALFLMLMVVSAWVTVIGPHQSPNFRVAAGTAGLYVNNWWLILRDVSYFAQFDAPGPLNHLWSLSVEEQFYIVWPLLLLVGTRVLRQSAPRLLRPRLGLAVLGLAAASSVAMAVLYHPADDPSRVYYGTDTRAAELLVGAALAAVWPSQGLRSRIRARARTTVDLAGVLGLGVIALMFLRVDEFSSFLYRGGFVVLSAAVVLLVASVAHPASRLGPVIGCRPMRWIGARSYGLYLWHFPIIILTTPEGVGTASAARSVLQVAATFGVAALSWRFVEDPIRHGALGRAWAQRREGSWRPTWRPTPARGVAFAGGALMMVGAVAGFAGVGVAHDRLPTDEDIAITRSVTEPPSTAPLEAPTDDGVGSCSSVVHIGGSTSLGLVSTAYIPDEQDQIPAQYTRVGVTTQHYEIYGGVAIIEGYRDSPTARESGQKWRDSGYRGCWVLALGTMDAANVAKSAGVGFEDRIDTMMEIADGDPVLWINVRTVARTGYWRADVMPPWNEALLAACAKYPNMRIYDWASAVQDDWFGSDGIHNNTVGYTAFAKNVADALARAFPDRAAPSSDCLIAL
jgi:peptidoglycan/LPS O-acetylase OafA/YrhL